MLPNNIMNRQYVLSLDGLDLSLLSQYVQQPTNEKRLLWSKPKLDGELVYCEIQMPLDENEDSCIEPSEVYMCHICNINVPKQYFKQHNSSRRHLNYKRLTEKAVANVLKQINIDIDSVADSCQHDEFYCEICSKVILVKNKHKHNRSRYHLKAIEELKSADDFIELYVGNTEVETTIRSVQNDTVYDKNTEYDSESETVWNFDSDIETEFDTNVKEVIHINNVLPETSAKQNRSVQSNNTITIGTNKDIIDFQLYLKEMIAKYKLKFNMPIIEDNSIVIVTPKGYREKVTIDTFHGYKNENNVTHCQLCRVYITSTSISQRSTSECHVKSIIQPIDNNFARQLVIDKSWSHCLLCDLIVYPGLNHATLSPIHIKYWKLNTVKKETPTLTNLTTKKTYCGVCNVYIDTNNYPAHAKGRKHKSKLKLVTTTSSPVATKNNNIPSQNVNLHSSKYCDICKVPVPGGGMAIHVTGKPHKTKCAANIQSAVKEIRTELNKLTVVDGKLTVKSNLPSSSTINADKATKVAEYKKQMTEYSVTEVKCLVCKLKVPNIDKNIIEHVEGDRHKKALNVILSNNNIIKQSFKLYYCELCKSNFDNFYNHINYDVNHLVKMRLS